MATRKASTIQIMQQIISCSFFIIQMKNNMISPITIHCAITCSSLSSNGIVSHVTLIEFGTELKADQVLQNRLYSLNNVTVIKNAQTKEITGTTVVNGITYIERDSKIEQHIELQGVFIQIGLVPNTDWLGDTLEKTRFGEIVVNSHGATNVPGIFAAVS